MRNFAKKRQKGMSLIEIMLVVGLAAIFVIGALVYYQSAQTSTKTQQTVEGVTSLTAVIRNQFATQGHYNGVTQTIVARFGNVPQVLRLDDTDTLIHPWNKSSGAITIGQVTGTGTATTPSHFYIQLADMPARTCMDMVTKLFKNYAVTVGATAPTTTTGLADIAAANTACGTGGAGALVTLNFVTQ